MISERKTSADLIRLFSALSIIVIHITSLMYYSLEQIGYRSWLITNSLSWSLKWAAPMFVMISGYFLLNSNTSQKPKNFFSHRFGKLIAPLLLWSFIYYLISLKGTGESLSLLAFFDKLWHSGTYYHLYFINVIFGLYLVTPFLKKHIVNKNLSSVVPALFIFSFLYLIGYSFFGFPQVDTIFTWFLPYLGYYLAGYWLSKLPTPKRPIFLIIVGLFLLLFGVMATGKLFFLFETSEKVTFLVKHFSPIIITTSLAFFYVIINISNQHLRALLSLSKLSGLSLGLYFIHPLWIYVYDNYSYLKSLQTQNYWLWLVGMIFLCITSSFLSVFLLKKIPLVNKFI